MVLKSNEYARQQLIKSWEASMESGKQAYFDLETVALLRATLDEAWASVRFDKRATLSRSLLAERILKLAAEGERDPERLLNAALVDLAA